MTDETPGVAYDLWLRVRAEQASRGWTDVELQRRSGIPRGTVDRLRRGKRVPQARVVNALADALGIPRAEAARLAGLVPEGPAPAAGQVSVREAIQQDPTYTDEERAVLLALVDLIDRAAARRRRRQKDDDGDDEEAA